ncbi:hypothetical protein BN1184_AH_00530 [Pantoea ananatis]|nr:hypothetical protein BN1182_AL_00580 [Pantoea ananatis]CRH36408.1 hypothetical protein BN1184_AH_00530 [Pantoea ananatis]
MTSFHISAVAQATAFFIVFLDIIHDGSFSTGLAPHASTFPVPLIAGVI